MKRRAAVTEGMMENGICTTKVITEVGRVYDLGERQFVPKHKDHDLCPACNIVNAWTERIINESKR